MGHGSYSVDNKLKRDISKGHISSISYDDNGMAELDSVVYDKSRGVNTFFQSRNMNDAMSPFNLTVREARDSEEHPNSVPIIIGLDVTGSMGSIPLHLIKDGLPTLMSTIIQAGVRDAQVLFTAIGDHECDSSPLQVAQFESSDELLDKWLQDTYLEGGGGGNEGESYLLAWYLAGYHTSIDSFEKRQKKGFLFTIGDEPTLNQIPKEVIKGIMGEGQYEDFTAKKLFEKAEETYHVRHIHLRETRNGSMKDIQQFWIDLIGDKVIFVDTYSEIPKVIAETILKIEDLQIVEKPVTFVDGEKVEEIML